MRVPIACTLSADAATDRIAEWRAPLSASVADAVKTAPGRVELRLVDAPATAGRLVDLAQREKTCCAFFTFTMEIEAEGATLVVEVPEDAEVVLDEFVALVRP